MEGGFEDLYNIDTHKQVAVHMRTFDGIRRGNTSEEKLLEELRLK